MKSQEVWFGMYGIFTATACLGCIPWANPFYSRFTLDGSSPPIFPYTGGCVDAMKDEDVDQMGDNPYVLARDPAPLFYGADWDEVSTIGGFPFWIEDCHYTPCPDCGNPMKFVAKLCLGADTPQLAAGSFIHSGFVQRFLLGKLSL